MTDDLTERREWEQAFVAALAAEAARRERDGTGSRPGQRTEFAGLRNITLRHDGASVVVEAELSPPTQDRYAADETRSIWTLTSDNWGRKRNGLTRHPAELAARLAFRMLDRDPED
jgi:hypothetical protein